MYDKPIGALPLTKCHFSHYLFWLRRILWGMGGGGLKKGGNAPRATESQRCKSSASYPPTPPIVIDYHGM